MSEATKDQAEAEASEAEASEAEASASKAEEPELAAQAPAEPDATEATEAPAGAAAESKTSVQQSEDDDEGALDATGRERPRFLLGFPQHPDLQRLAAAFEAGNYALVREEAEALAERAESPAVRDAALELRRRIDPDPLAKYLLALTAALLLSLAYFAYHH
jgi:hypothetical protein